MAVTVPVWLAWIMAAVVLNESFHQACVGELSTGNTDMRIKTDARLRELVPAPRSFEAGFTQPSPRLLSQVLSFLYCTSIAEIIKERTLSAKAGKSLHGSCSARQIASVGAGQFHPRWMDGLSK